jgi:hypothetical protein
MTTHDNAVTFKTVVDMVDVPLVVRDERGTPWDRSPRKTSNFLTAASGKPF